MEIFNQRKLDKRDMTNARCKISFKALYLLLSYLITETSSPEILLDKIFHLVWLTFSL